MSELEGQQELDLWPDARHGEPGRAGPALAAAAGPSRGEPVIDGVFTAPRIARPFANQLPDVSSHRTGGDPSYPGAHAEHLVHWSTWGYTNPEVVRSVWRALEWLGFERGRVLEPGAGGGAFTAMAPSGAKMTRIEMLAANARRAQRLYPEADVRWESFAASTFPEAHFDVVAGSFPLVGGARPRDARNIGHHFLLKSLALTRPGGVVAVVTNHRTLDDEDPRVRRELHAMADLLGAVRMPDGLNYRANGQESSGDVLLLRRREPGAEPISSTWVNSLPIQIDGHATHINHHYLERPGNVLGRLEVSHVGSSAFLHVVGDLDRAPVQVADALVDIATMAQRQGQVIETSASRDPAIATRGDVWDLYRGALATLGDARAAELFNSVGADHDDVREVDEASLRAARDAAVDALYRLNHASARAASDLEHAQRMAEQRSRDDEGSDGIAAALQQLHEADQWLQADGQVVARWVARERVHAREEGIAIATTDRTGDRPLPAPPPDRGGPDVGM